MNRPRITAALAALFLGASGVGVATADEQLPAPEVTGTAADQRAVLDWNDVTGAYDYIVYDVTQGEPGRVVGRTIESEWTSIRIPLNRGDQSFEVVARERDKDQGLRSDTVTVDLDGQPEEPTEPPTEPTEPTDPPTEPEEPPTEPEEPPTEPEEPTEPPADRQVIFGAAVNPDVPTDPEYQETFLTYFDGGTTENAMKFRSLHPEPGRYTFAQADAMVNLMVENGMPVRGHTLAWFGGNPSWVTQTAPADRAAILEEHITTVVNHFEGRVDVWDVWNEAVADNGSGLRTDSPWNPEGTIEPIVAAFQAAHAADPTADLCVNDFSVSHNRPKVAAYRQLVIDLRAAGAPVNCVGFQGHNMTETEPYADTQVDPGGWSPTAEEVETILQSFADIEGIDVVQFTEVDIRTNDAPADFTREQRDRAQALVARNMAQGCLAVSECNWFGVWNLPEEDSWMGAGAEATFFTNDLQPKPAYWAVREIIGGGPAR